MLVSDTISTRDSYYGRLCKSHAIHNSGVGARVMSGVSVLLQRLVAHQNAISSYQVGWVLVVAKGVLIFKGSPKASIPALVGLLQKGQARV